MTACDKVVAIYGPLVYRLARRKGLQPTDADDLVQEVLVAGAPPWLDGPIAMSCPRCNNELIYVAALSNVESFKPCVPINNESGYQYHFACDDCRTLSVVAQWS